MTRIESAVKGRTFSLVMFACVLGFVLFKRFYRDLGDIFIAIAVLGTFASAYYNFRSIKKDPIFIAFFLSLLIPVMSWINSKVQIPELAKQSPAPFLFYDFFFFWFIAYWTQGKTVRIATILLTYCVGILGIYLSHSPDFLAEIGRGLRGARVDFGLVNAQHTSLFAGFGFIASAFLLVVRLDLPLKYEAIKKSGAIVLLAFFTLVIVISQSRQVWLGLLTCLLLAPLALKLIAPSRVSTRSTILTYLVFTMMVGGLSTLDVVERRISAEQKTINKLVDLDLESVSDSGSIGLRLHLWSEAWDWIRERPLLGSGEDARELVIVQSAELPDSVRSTFTHLHNSHVETLVSFGLVGAALVYFVLLWPPFFTATTTSVPVKKTWKVLALVVAIFWLTVNCFESYFYAANGAYIFAVFYGVIYSFKFGQKDSATDQLAETPRKKYFCQV